MQSLNLPIAKTLEISERRDAAENRHQILKTADALFKERGVENVCMSEIAKGAKVGKGTLYRRFSSKGELCLALLDSELQLFQNHILQSFREKIDRDESIRERLVWFIGEAVRFTQTHLDLMVEISALGSENAVQDVNQPHFWMEMTVKAHLKEMVQAGKIPAKLDLDYLSSALLAPLDARILKNHLNSRDFSVEQVSSGLQTLIRSLSHEQ